MYHGKVRSVSREGMKCPGYEVAKVRSVLTPYCFNDFLKGIFNCFNLIQKRESLYKDLTLYIFAENFRTRSSVLELKKALDPCFVYKTYGHTSRNQTSGSQTRVHMFLYTKHGTSVFYSRTNVHMCQPPRSSLVEKNNNIAYLQYQFKLIMYEFCQ